MKLKLPDKVKEIIRELEKGGFEAYAVGGCIRDSLLGRSPNDWDITTSALPRQIKEIFPHTIDTGIAHGTVTVMTGGEGFEITTYRVDGEYRDHRHPKDVTFTASLEEDLKRRDFTINAMAYNPTSGLVDLFGGVDDLADKKIRCVGNPLDRFEEDALRIMRAIRFSAQLGFELEEHTADSLSALAANLKDVSAERIQAELVKILTSPHPEYLAIAYRHGITAMFLPEFDRCMETPQNTPHHCYNVGEHSLHSLEAVRPDRLLRITMLLHDIGKPCVRITDISGRDHFKTHAAKGAEMAEDILRRLKFDNETIRLVSRLILHHDDRPLPEEKAVRRAINHIGPDIFPLYLEVQRADMLSQSTYRRQEKEARIEGVSRIYEEIIARQQCVTLKDLAAGGRDLMEIGYRSGPELGECLKRLLDHVLDNPQDNEKDILLDLARKWSK